MTPPSPLTAAVVILTRGDRQTELATAVASVRSQSAGPELIVVANGAEIDAIPGAEILTLAANAGVPGGRNAGAAAAEADIVCFLDDDARYGNDDVVMRVLEAFAAEPTLGVVSLRIRDESGATTARRHVPRLRVGDPQRSSDVTTFLGGASAVRRALFDQVGGFPSRFFYAHEETDFAWRVIDAGYRIRYRGDLEVVHPATEPADHDDYHYLSARNRAWLIRRRLPWPVGVIYGSVWLLLSLLRPPRPTVWPAVLRGWGAGMREPAGARQPIRWKTVALMTRWGRPPIV